MSPLVVVSFPEIEADRHLGSASFWTIPTQLSVLFCDALAGMGAQCLVHTSALPRPLPRFLGSFVFAPPPSILRSASHETAAAAAGCPPLRWAVSHSARTSRGFAAVSRYAVAPQENLIQTEAQV